jgi:hypothetical protein
LLAFWGFGFDFDFSYSELGGAEEEVLLPRHSNADGRTKTNKKTSIPGMAFSLLATGQNPVMFIVA